MLLFPFRAQRSEPRPVALLGGAFLCSPPRQRLRAAELLHCAVHGAAACGEMLGAELIHQPANVDFGPPGRLPGRDRPGKFFSGDSCMLMPMQLLKWINAATFPLVVLGDARRKPRLRCVTPGLFLFPKVHPCECRDGDLPYQAGADGAFGNFHPSARRGNRPHHIPVVAGLSVLLTSLPNDLTNLSRRGGSAPLHFDPAEQELPLSQRF
jgi:hypothetical protein